MLAIQVLFYDRNHFAKPFISAAIRKTVLLHVTYCKGSGNFQLSFVKKWSDRYNFPRIYATVLKILVACASHMSIIDWYKSVLGGGGGPLICVIQVCSALKAMRFWPLLVLTILL